MARTFVDQLVAVPAGNSSLLMYPAGRLQHKADYNSHVTECLEHQRTRARRKSRKGHFLGSLAGHREHLRPRAPTHPDSRLWRRWCLLAVAAVAARGGGARSSQPTPASSAANQQWLGRRNDLTGSTLLPLPHVVVGVGSQSREVWGRGMGGELVMSPFLCVIGCRVAGLRPINSLEKSGAAPRKALLPPGGGPAVVGWRALQCGQRAWPGAEETSQLPRFGIFRTTYFSHGSHRQTSVGV